jgi:hypothetical protein
LAEDNGVLYDPEVFIRPEVFGIMRTGSTTEKANVTDEARVTAGL